MATLRVPPAGSISGGSWRLPKHDAAGNMIRAPRPGQESAAAETLLAVYDAWNRPVKVYKDANADGSLDENDTLIAEYRYDGLSRRIQKIVAGSPAVTYDYYYNESWQCLEERKTVGQGQTQTYAQYVWDPRYIDAPVLRDRDSDNDPETGTLGGTGNPPATTGLDERLYYCNDANMNVTALVDAANGNVVERMMYDPYGRPTFYNGSWQNPSNSSAYANDILYCGYRFDNETGLYHVRNRYYHPTLGRWISRDPIRYEDGMSLYKYVRGNPLRRADAMGLSDIWEGVGSNSQALREQYYPEGVPLAQLLPVLTRIGGGLKVVGGVAGGVICLGGAVVTSETLILPAIFLGGAYLNVDIAQAGFNELLTGRPTPTLTNQAATEVATYAGLPPETAKTIGYYTELGQDLGAMLISVYGSVTIATKGPVAAGRLTVSGAESKAALNTGTRYVGPEEARIIKETGRVPNINKLGEPKSVFYTPEQPLSSASQAKQVYNLSGEPTHAVIVDTAKAAPDYAGNVLGSQGIEATTRTQLPALEIRGLNP